VVWLYGRSKERIGHCGSAHHVDVSMPRCLVERDAGASLGGQVNDHGGLELSQYSIPILGRRDIRLNDRRCARRRLRRITAVYIGMKRIDDHNLADQRIEQPSERRPDEPGASSDQH